MVWRVHAGLYRESLIHSYIYLHMRIFEHRLSYTSPFLLLSMLSRPMLFIFLEGGYTPYFISSLPPFLLTFLYTSLKSKLPYSIASRQKTLHFGRKHISQKKASSCCLSPLMQIQLLPTRVKEKCANNSNVALVGTLRVVQTIEISEKEAVPMLPS